MLPRLLLLPVILVLLVIVAFQIGLVHSDPGIPIEDLPYITGAMALISFMLFRPQRAICREIAPGLLFVGLSLGLWLWVLDQYRRAERVRVDRVSLVFSGLYFPKNSLRYTFTALGETRRPEDEVGREILGRLKAEGVPVAAQLVHFSSPPATSAETRPTTPGR